MMGRRLFSYFYKWKRTAGTKSVLIRTRFRSIILRLYEHKMRSAFTNWLSKQGTKAGQLKRKMVDMQVEHCNMMRNEVIDGKRSLEKQRQAVSSMARKGIAKTSKKVEKRVILWSWIRWQRLVHIERLKESKAEFILNHLRNNIVSQYFRRYKDKVQYMSRLRAQLKRSDNLIDLFNKRRMLKIVQQWCAYNHQHAKARQYMKMLFQELITNKTRRALYRWRQGAEYFKIDIMRDGQN